MPKTKSKSKKSSKQKELALVKDLAQDRLWEMMVKQGRRSGASPETLNNMICGEPSVLPPRKQKTAKEKKPVQPVKIEKVAINQALDSILDPVISGKDQCFANEGGSLFHVDLEKFAKDLKKPKSKKRTKAKKKTQKGKR